MRIIVDTEACTGHAMCQAQNSEVFVLDDLGYNTTPVIEVDVANEDAARRGVLACPERAMTIAEDG